MVYAYTQDIPVNEEVYRRITSELGDAALDGLLLHLCVRKEDGSLRYIEVWESEAKCAAAFEERIHPAVDRAFGGHRPGTEPAREALDVIDARGSVLG